MSKHRLSQPHQSFHPRDIAIRVLTRVLSDRKTFEDALAECAEGLSSEARSWLQEVCSGTLRWKGRIDLVLDSLSLKKKPSGWLRKALSIATYQLIVQEKTPPALVVSETVSLVRGKEGEAPAKFSNAMLRKVADHAMEWRTLSFNAQASGADAARWASLPEWFWKKIVQQYGLDWARAYAMASLDRPTLWIRTKRPDWRPEWGAQSAQTEQVVEVGGFPGAMRVLRLPSGPMPEWPGFREGEFFVQDISSQQLIAEVTRELKNLHAEHFNPSSFSVLDLCAAPGGKTAGMAWNGFRVTATDRDESRFSLLHQTVSRVAPEVQVIPRGQVQALSHLNLIWVDAPCSGSGILRRHPEIRWLRQERELDGLRNVQAELLKEAWEKLSSGDFLVYSVCSVLKEEGPDALKQIKVGAQLINEWYLAPHIQPGGDGFYAALLKKR